LSELLYVSQLIYPKNFQQMATDTASPTAFLSGLPVPSISRPGRRFARSPVTHRGRLEKNFHNGSKIRPSENIY
jgi:hypothetical protein